MSRVRLASAAALTALIALTLAAFSAPAGGDTAPVTVSMTVPSATNLSVDPTDPPTAGSCLGNVVNVTDFGTVLPGQEKVTSTDCEVVFGSSNDTSMLLAYQADGLGTAMMAATSGDVDTNFDTDGYLTLDLGGDESIDWGPSATERDGGVTRMQDDGKILYAFSYDNSWAVARFNQDGTLDTSFASPAGWINIPGFDHYPDGMAIQDDGKILISGAANSDWGTARLNPDGTLDTNTDSDPASHWNTVGYQQETLTGSDAAFAIDVLSTGRVVAVGTDGSNVHIRAYTANGALDTGFAAPDGYITWGQYDATAVVVDDSDRVLVLSHTTTAVYVDALTANGTTDVTFNAGDTPGWEEILWTDFRPGAVDAISYDLVLDDAGRIHVAVATNAGAGNWDYGIARLTATGTLDSTFASDGATFVDLELGDTPSNLIIDHEGRAVVSGVSSADDTRADPTVLRLTETGALDDTFSGDGIGQYLPPGVGPLGGDIAGVVQSADGSLYLQGSFDTGAGGDLLLIKLGGAEIADYTNLGGGGDTDWASATSTSMFGACLRAVSGTGVGGTWTEDPDNDCTEVDTDPWYAFPTDSGDAGAKVAESATSGTVDATALLRFGVRPADDQPPGTYRAPITFEAVAPNV